MGGVGGDGVEDKDCESAVDDDDEEDCESLAGEYGDEEEEEDEEEEDDDDDKRITDNHYIRNEHFDFSQATRENEGTPHLQHQNMSEADYHSGDTSEEEDGGVSLYF
ncbi:hypothetical protein BOTNAR_0554g00090 [Botryotinia narcissicola]|uniref:Uncharacterized protein n=1 Tax=Botryotinia narcissicola TaxID=278944 RepID=A0A4Z1HIA4_9HELO|nr:hypothetical protein BOTNAR_0554g00090 [Botryotinia narcissicola]